MPCADIPHLRRLRIHTRLPIVLPERVDAELLAWLRGLPWPVAVVIHANHANEIDAAVDAGRAPRCARPAPPCSTRRCCCAGVNDSVPSAGRAVRTRLFDAGVLPYYLHQLDRVAGAAHFEVPDAEARPLHAALAARLPGYLVPRLVREVAGAPGKTALRPWTWYFVAAVLVLS